MSSPTKKMYIYNLPHTERRDLCRILDQNNKWEELAGTHMKYDVLTIQELRREIYRGHSPTEELLTMWGHQNHTVLELFILLSRMHHYQAMTKIKKFVDSEYHRLIDEGEQNPNVLMQQLALNDRDNRDKEENVPKENFNKSEKILNVLRRDLGVHNENANVAAGYNVPNVIVQEGMHSKDDNYSNVQHLPQQLLKPKSPVLLRPRVPSVSEISSVAESAGAIPHIAYEELQKSTNNWDHSSILGKGGFGTVFKGTWKCTQVAIKRIEEKDDPEAHNIQIKQSITELHCLNAYRHDNILPLYGYSIGGPQPCLVYQYMPGGCLERRLKIQEVEKILKWPSRLNIAIGTARGLQFLHTIGDKPLIHGDIKSANILLDPNDMPRIGDFGLAREGPESDYTHIKVSRIHGTRPYLPDEFLRGKKFSTKVDTYSFGVVLFELATSLPAYSDKREDRFLKDHVENFQGNMLRLKHCRAIGGEQIFQSLIGIGKLCVSKRAKDRPEMVQVLIELEKVTAHE